MSDWGWSVTDIRHCIRFYTNYLTIRKSAQNCFYTLHKGGIDFVSVKQNSMYEVSQVWNTKQMVRHVCNKMLFFLQTPCTDIKSCLYCLGLGCVSSKFLQCNPCLPSDWVSMCSSYHQQTWQTYPHTSLDYSHCRLLSLKRLSLAYK